MQGTHRSGGGAPVLALLDQLDAVVVRVADEAEPVAAVAHGVGRPLGLDAEVGQALKGRVEVVDRERDVPVAGADLVRALLVLVPGQLEPRAVAGEAHEDVDGLVADRHPGQLLEAELLVELDAAVDLEDAVTGVDELAHSRQVTGAGAGRSGEPRAPAPPAPRARRGTNPPLPFARAAR